MLKILPATIVAFFAVGVCHAEPFMLSCNSSLKEQALIRSRAPEVASRKGKHELKIVTAKGILTFTDKPPHDEPLSGVHHYFCDRKEGFILLRVEDESLFTGKLINEQTGVVTDAGQDVLFSADRRAYFATEQPDGLDGETWNIYAIDGRRSWSGYSFIPKSNEPLRLSAYLENAKWLPNGEFSATASCGPDSGKKWTVKLVKDKGYWDWKPKKNCPSY
jgi:hypothetical protein